ncbi:MAG: cytochrome c [Cohaesibacter sp.]|jgi:cytochrome c556|nr:cytochrome c [Cohaesibacter sp.]
MRKIILAAATACLFASPALAADDPKLEAVEARQGYYKLLGANMGVLAGMAKGEIEYDAEKAKLHAGNIAKLSETNISFLYIPGTSAEDMAGKTRALPAIWKDMPGVGAAAKKYVEAAANIAKVAGEGRASLGGGVKMLGGSCKGCHDNYRAK